MAISAECQLKVNNQTDLKDAPGFTERPAWHAIGNGWRHLHGSVSGAGLSFEWHNFMLPVELNWGKSFQPGSIEVCLNRDGNGRIASHNHEAAFTPLTIGFYRRGDEALAATRQANQRHQFLTVEMSFDFLRRHLGEFVTSLHPLSPGGRAGSVRKVSGCTDDAIDNSPIAFAREPAESASAGDGAVSLVSS